MMRKNQHGYTLIEMLVAVVIGSLLLASLSMLLVVVMEATAGSTQAVARQQELMLLADAWRKDVHTTREVAWRNEQESDLRVGDVVYALKPDAVVRTAYADEKPVAQESFELRPAQSATLIVDEEQGIATLRIRETDPPSESLAKNWDIVAAIGLDLRYREVP